MDRRDAIKKFYLEHLPGSKMEGNLLKAPCPFCPSGEGEKPATMVVHLAPESFFMGYFRCLRRCICGGFAPHFAMMMGIGPQEVPGCDPDHEAYVRDIVYPSKNLNAEMKKAVSLMGDHEYDHFKTFGVSRAVLAEMKIGYNGRYLLYPYFLEDGNCYAAHCILPEKQEDHFWHGNEEFFSEEFRVFNEQEIERCEDGALFIVEGENNLLVLRELGYPGIAVSTASDLESIVPERLAHVRHVFLWMNHTPEAHLSVRSVATRLGFKARIVKWPPTLKRGYSLCRMAEEKGKDFRSAASSMIKAAKSFSPFSSPEKEHRRFFEVLEMEKGQSLPGLSSGFQRVDESLNGIRGINIMGGSPKAGKSCFFMQMSTEMARLRTPVIYYDFENSRRIIYLRTLCRLSKLSEKEIRSRNLDEAQSRKLEEAFACFRELLEFFRVVTDRKLSPDLMRRQIDFLQHETRKDHTLVVVDSLHKLPFKSLSDRRTGIDSWLRHMEAIRDEQNTSFLVISELSRGQGGSYDKKPDLGSFKESGDIEYSADNAMILIPEWDPLSSVSTEQRTSILWLVASRENSPGKIATYLVEYPYWGFQELD